MPLVTRSGLNPDGTCSHVTIGKIEIPYISISYGDNTKSEWVYKAGQQEPEADTPGQYEPADGTLKVSRLNADLFVFPNLPKFGAANVRRLAIVSYDHPEIGSNSDALIAFRIMGAKSGSEAGSKSLEVEFTVRYRAVAWTEKRIRLGHPTGTGAEGTIRL